MKDAEVLEALDQVSAFAHRLIQSKIWRGNTGGVLPEGQAAPDIVQHAMEKILTGAKWDEDKPLWLVLRGLVMGRISNLVRSWENRHFSNPDDQNPLDNDQLGNSITNSFTATDEDPYERLAREEDDIAILEISEALNDKPAEKLVVDAIINGVTKRAEIMELTGLNKQEYEAVKKRLRRFLESFGKNGFRLNIKG